jgi:transcription elongation factor Elf1
MTMADTEPKLNHITSEWKAAAIALAQDPSAVVPCPGCGNAKLEVVDVHGRERFVRTIYCKACGKEATLHMGASEQRVKTVREHSAK